ncbi:chemotaxis response regulator protein-glutamate methylesterase [Verrucomicrobia bacterium LW23]|nr:chemotaxis response regulator protein-glutamate methylesterase [Verrucomicrobia bacterium LW23]
MPESLEPLRPHAGLYPEAPNGIPSRSSGGAIRVLVVDDSAAVRELLREMLQQDPALQVAATATNGEEAVRLVEKLKPDVVTMDIHMPVLDGFGATQQIMQRFPVPIVIISGSLDLTEVSVSFQAMAAGAVAVVQRPRGVGHPSFGADTLALVRIIKAMAEVKVVRRWPSDRPAPATSRSDTSALPTLAAASAALTPIGERASRTPGTALYHVPASACLQKRRVDIVAIGTSTGGPQALHALFSQLPAPLPVPVAIVQHMTEGFMPGYTQWLERAVPFPVELATDGGMLQPGRVYLAPDGAHLTVNGFGRALLSRAEPVNGLRPAVSELFSSVAAGYGSRAVAMLLTGMGTDGAAELRELRDRGALTIAQSAESSVVFGMPGHAVRLDAAELVLSPEQIAVALTRLFRLTPSNPTKAVPHL